MPGKLNMYDQSGHGLASVGSVQLAQCGYKLRETTQPSIDLHDSIKNLFVLRFYGIHVRIMW